MNKKILIFFTISLIALAFLFLPTNSQALVAQKYICPSLSRSIYFGSYGSDVRSLQEFLRDKGYFTGNSTKFFGYMTFRSLVNWQKANGINAIGVAGPATRNKISETCNIVNPVNNFVPAANCSAWFDGCNECSRSTPGGNSVCTLRYCFAAGQGYCKSNFQTNPTMPPTISGISGPTNLLINQSGTWSITATNLINKQLSYSVTWGDENLNTNSYVQNNVTSSSVNQTTTFGHSYAYPGSYIINIRVTDQNGQMSRSSITVVVAGNSGGTICYDLYQPVCGLLNSYTLKTYSNSCTMNAAGATLLYAGQCNNGN
jgi:hypothetical protein